MSYIEPDKYESYRHNVPQYVNHSIDLIKQVKN